MLKGTRLTKTLLAISMATVCLVSNVSASSDQTQDINSISQYVKSDNDGVINIPRLIHYFIKKDVCKLHKDFTEEIRHRLSGYTAEEIQIVINNIENYQSSDLKLTTLDKDIIQQVIGMLEQEKKIAEVDLFLEQNCQSIVKENPTQKDTTLATECTRKQEEKRLAGQCTKLYDNLMNLKIDGRIYEMIDGKKRYLTDTEIKEKHDLIQGAICQVCYDYKFDD